MMGRSLAAPERCGKAFRPYKKGGRGQPPSAFCTPTGALLHKFYAAAPGLPHFFTNGIIAALECIEQEGIQLFRRHAALFVQNGFVGQHVHNFA